MALLKKKKKDPYELESFDTFFGGNNEDLGNKSKKFSNAKEPDKYALEDFDSFFGSKESSSGKKFKQEKTTDKWGMEDFDTFFGETQPEEETLIKPQKPEEKNIFQKAGDVFNQVKSAVTSEGGIGEKVKNFFISPDEVKKDETGKPENVTIPNYSEFVVGVERLKKDIEDQLTNTSSPAMQDDVKRFNHFTGENWYEWSKDFDGMTGSQIRQKYEELDKKIGFKFDSEEGLAKWDEVKAKEMGISVEDAKKLREQKESEWWAKRDEDNQKKFDEKTPFQKLWATLNPFEDDSVAVTAQQYKLKKRLEILDQYLGNEPTKRGFLQGMWDEVLDDPTKLVPFMSEGAKKKTLEYKTEALQKYEKGEELSPEEYNEVLLLRTELLEQHINRGTAYQAGESVVNMIPFAAESYVLSGGGKLYSGIKSLAPVAKNTIGKLATSLVTNGIGALIQSEANQPAISNQTAEYMLPEYDLVAGENGDLILEKLDEGDSFDKASKKAHLSAFFESASERVGSVIDEGLPFMKKGILAKFGEKLGIKDSPTLKKLAEGVGWNGILEEVFEEEINEPVQAAIEERKYAAPGTPEGNERLLVEAIGITAFGGLFKIPDLTINKLFQKREQIEKSTGKKDVIDIPVSDKVEEDEEIQQTSEEGTGEEGSADYIPPIFTESVQEAQQQQEGLKTEEGAQQGMMGEQPTAGAPQAQPSTSSITQNLQPQEQTQVQGVEQTPAPSPQENLGASQPQIGVQTQQDVTKGTTLTDTEDLDKINKAKIDIERARDYMERAPESSDDFSVKTKADYERYIKEVEGWIANKEKITKEKETEKKALKDYVKKGINREVQERVSEVQAELRLPLEMRTPRRVSNLNEFGDNRVSSTEGIAYPAWIDQPKLRSGTVVREAADALASGTPPKEGSKARELYDLSMQEAKRRVRGEAVKEEVRQLKKEGVKKEEKKEGKKETKQPDQKKEQKDTDDGDIDSSKIESNKAMEDIGKQFEKGEITKEQLAGKAKEIYDKLPDSDPLKGAIKTAAMLYGADVSGQDTNVRTTPKSTSASDTNVTTKPSTPSGAGNADVGGYSNIESVDRQMNKFKPMEMPEILEMYKEISGTTPKVKENLGRKLGYALGMDITLASEIFKDPEVAAKVFAHEIGHVADYLPDKTTKRGNILGRIASLNKNIEKFIAHVKGDAVNPITAEDKARLRKEAKEIAKTKKEVSIEEIVKEENVKPEDVLKIWNDVTASFKDEGLNSYISKLSRQQKAQIIRAAMKGELPAWVEYKRQVKETITKDVYESSPDKVRRAFEDLVRAEVEKRRMYSADIISKELKKFTQLWKPFNDKADSKFTQYRYSSKELYADAISGLINDPALLKETAPMFWDSFFAYLNEKPAVKAAFEGTWELLNRPEEEVFKKRNATIDRAYQDAEKAFYAKEVEKRKKDTNLLFHLGFLFNDKNQATINKFKKDIKEGKIKPEDNPIYALEEQNYFDGKLKNFINDHFQKTFEKVQTIPDGWNLLGKVVQLERVVNERGEMANPQGFDPETAKTQLAYLEKQTPKEQWAVIEEAKKDFREGVQVAVAEAEKEGFYKPEMIEEMKANPAYATFQVIDYIDTNISPNVYRSIGTLKDVANPATSTTMKMMSVMKAVERNRVKRLIVENLQKLHPDDIQEAQSTFDGKTRTFKESPDKDLALVRVIENGELKGYYVDKYIASSVNYMSNNTLDVLSKVIRKVSGTSIYRPLFTSFNLGFQSFNFVRDFFRYWKNTPDANFGQALTSMPRAVGQYLKAIPNAWNRATNRPDALIKTMENAGMLGLNFNDLYGDISQEDTQIERILDRVGSSPLKTNKKKFFLVPFIKALGAIETMGNFIETLPKVAGYNEMKGRMSEKELAHFIRTRVGSPDFRRTGSLTPVTNNIFMFSNAIKEGWRGDLESLQDPKTRAGFLWKTTAMVLFPKLLMMAILKGLFGDELKKILEGTSEYDRTNYMVIPLGLDENGKSVVLRVPQDETTRFISGIFWKMMQKADQKEMGIGDVFQVLDYGAGQLPNLAPSITGAGSLLSYFSGKNPYDSFRDRYVVPDEEFKAGPKYSFPIYLDWLLKNQGLGVIAPSYSGGQDDKTKTDLQKTVELPFLANTLGRWLKVTDYGITEKAQAIKNESEKEQAIQNLESEKKMNRYIDEYLSGEADEDRKDELIYEFITDVLGEEPDDGYSGTIKTKATNLEKKFNKELVKKEGDPYMNALRTATSNADKAKILDMYYEELNDDEFEALIDNAVESQLISESFYNDYLEGAYEEE